MITLKHVLPALVFGAGLACSPVFAQSSPPPGPPPSADEHRDHGEFRERGEYREHGDRWEGEHGWHHHHHHHHWHRWHHGPREGGAFGGGMAVLHRLHLTPEQRTKVMQIMTSEKSAFEALRASSEKNRAALATTPPTDRGYASLISTAQANAAQRIKLASETWSKIYTSVLTPEQQKAIPALATERDHGEHDGRDWKGPGGHGDRAKP